MNHLIHESSPYLLQHAHNPVDWYAWSPEALEKSRVENKPILLSIGYSTCHWCHVMERESFENQEVAAFMNRHFVNIKVDREERPDLDRIYMEACQLISGSGGWPLNCFLMPDGRPFFAGTYFPPTPAHGRPSWQQVLQNIYAAFSQRPDVVEDQAARLTNYIRNSDNNLINKELLEKSEHIFSEQEVEKIYRRLEERFDLEDGGFGDAPKFPATMSLHFLLAYYERSRVAAARDHALFSIDKMIFGGIYDHLGGGFARYTTDKEWKIPHFEKMLYDNALLLTLLASAYKLSPELRYKETIEQTISFLENELKHSDGGYFSAIDADSEGEEGRFYVWQKEEIDALLGDDSELFCDFYNVTKCGNWEQKNIIFSNSDFEKYLQKNTPIDSRVAKQKLLEAKKLLLAHRNLRKRPSLDDKILLGWNALLCSAFCGVASALSDKNYSEKATQLLLFLTQKFGNGENGYFHGYKNGVGKQAAFLDDYAFLIAAMLDVYELNFDAQWIDKAASLTRFVQQNFLDEKKSLFFFTNSAQSDILLKQKDLYDSATPSGNSTMAKNLQRLAVLTGEKSCADQATQMLMAVKDSVLKYAPSFARWAEAVLWEVFPPTEIAVTGTDAKEIAAEINTFFAPNKVIMAASQPSDARFPLLEAKDFGTTAIYVCRNFACEVPVFSVAEYVKKFKIRENLKQ